MEPKTEKGRRRREEILNAAAECFARSGLHGASMADICAAAGTSPGAIYRYFPGKEAIIQAIAAREQAEIEDLIGEIVALRDPLKELPDLLGHVLMAELKSGQGALTVEFTAEAIRNPQFAALFRGAEDALVDALSARLERARADHMIDRALPAGQLAQLILILLEGLVIELALAPPQASAGLVKGFVKAVRKLLRPPA